MQGSHRRLLTIVVFSLVWLIGTLATAIADDSARIARIEASIAGDVIQSVTVQTYGVIKPEVVRQYLWLKEGDRLDQTGVDRDYENLTKLAGAIPRLTFEPGAESNTITLHWIVMDKWFALTEHPFYADTPLSAPIQGVGFILTAPPLNSHGSYFSAISQLSRRANLVRLFYTEPVHVDPVKGRESDLVFDAFGGRGVFRESQPVAINITAGTPALKRRITFTEQTTINCNSACARRERLRHSPPESPRLPCIRRASIRGATRCWKAATRTTEALRRRNGSRHFAPINTAQNILRLASQRWHFTLSKRAPAVSSLTVSSSAEMGFARIPNRSAERMPRISKRNIASRKRCAARCIGCSLRKRPRAACAAEHKRSHRQPSNGIPTSASALFIGFCASTSRREIKAAASPSKSKARHSNSSPSCTAAGLKKLREPPRLCNPLDLLHQIRFSG